jgi:hypothetical protein
MPFLKRRMGYGTVGGCLIWIGVIHVVILALYALSLYVTRHVGG